MTDQAALREFTGLQVMVSLIERLDSAPDVRPVAIGTGVRRLITDNRHIGRPNPKDGCMAYERAFAVPADAPRGLLVVGVHHGEAVGYYNPYEVELLPLDIQPGTSDAILGAYACEWLLGQGAAERQTVILFLKTDGGICLNESHACTDRFKAIVAEIDPKLTWPHTKPDRLHYLASDADTFVQALRRLVSEMP